jgi:Outer membrane protein beta-barrel domain
MLRGRLASLVVFLAVFTTLALAQPEYTPVELFAGYSLLPANGDDFPRQTSHGVQASVTGNLNHWFGVMGDIGIQFNTADDLGPGFEGRVARTRVTEFLVGPRFTSRSNRFNVCAYGLFGIARGDAGDDFSGFSDSALAFGGGGGVDIRVSRRFAIRTQFDLLGSFADIVEGNSRFAIGGVVGLGGS